MISGMREKAEKLGKAKGKELESKVGEDLKDHIKGFLTDYHMEQPGLIEGEQPPPPHPKSERERCFSQGVAHPQKS